MATISVISTICSELKYSFSASRVSRGVGGAGQLARVLDGGALGAAERRILLGAQRGQFLFA